MLFLNGSYIRCDISNSDIIPISSYLITDIYVDYGRVTLCDMINKNVIVTNFHEFNKCVFVEISNNEPGIQKVLDKIKNHFYTNHLDFAGHMQQLASVGSFNIFSKKYNDISEVFKRIDDYVSSKPYIERELFNFMDEIKLGYILDKL